MYKVVFFGTPNFSLPFLKNLHQDSKFEVKLVIGQPDKPAGRGQKMTSPPTIQYAKQHQIPYQQPAKLKGNNEIIKLLKDLEADFFIVVAYGKILKQDIINIPKKGCINVHPSLLPKYRGPSPIQESLKNGDSQTAISIMLLDEGMDSGPILSTKIINIDGDDNYSHLEQKILDEAPTLLLNTLVDYAQGNITPQTQDHNQATYCHLIKKEDAILNPSQQTAEEAYNIIRAYSTWPKASLNIYINNKLNTHKIYSAKKINNHNIEIGKIEISDKIIVGFKQGALEITKLQPEGKSPTESSHIINGWQGKNISLTP